MKKIPKEIQDALVIEAMAFAGRAANHDEEDVRPTPVLSAETAVAHSAHEGDRSRSVRRAVKITLISRRKPSEGGGYNAEVEDKLGEFSGPLVLTDRRVLDQFGPDSRAYFEIERPFRIGSRFL